MIEIVDMDMQLVLVTVLFIVQVPAESYKGAVFPSTECFWIQLVKLDTLKFLANQDQ